MASPASVITSSVKDAENSFTKDASSGALGALAGAAATGAEAVAGGIAGNATTDAFLLGMQQLTAESNKVQLEMGLMNLQKTVVEGFAKFLKDMGKGFTAN